MDVVPRVRAAVPDQAEALADTRKAGAVGHARVLDAVHDPGQLVGRGAGPVRPPLVDLTAAECAKLDELIKALGPQ